MEFEANREAKTAALSSRSKTREPEESQMTEKSEGQKSRNTAFSEDRIERLPATDEATRAGLWCTNRSLLSF